MMNQSLPLMFFLQIVLFLLTAGCEQTRLRHGESRAETAEIPADKLVGTPVFKLRRVGRSSQDPEIAGEPVYWELSEQSGLEGSFRAEGRGFKKGERLLLSRKYDSRRYYREQVEVVEETTRKRWVLASDPFNVIKPAAHDSQLTGCRVSPDQNSVLLDRAAERPSVTFTVSSVSAVPLSVRSIEVFGPSQLESAKLDSQIPTPLSTMAVIRLTFSQPGFHVVAFNGANADGSVWTKCLTLVEVIEAESTSGMVSLSGAPTLHFGEVLQFNELSHRVQLFNIGRAPSLIERVLEMESVNFRIARTNCTSGRILRPGEGCEIDVIFQPKTLGPTHTSLQIATHSLRPDGSPGRPLVLHRTLSGSSKPAQRLAAGNHTSFAIREGALFAWGYNAEGNLGDGTQIHRSFPVMVLGMQSGVTAVVAGCRHACAIKAGRVHCWGLNHMGQLGDGTTKNRAFPIPVPGIDSEVEELAAGCHTTFARTSDGRVYAWGYNGYGQIGDGTNQNRVRPILIPGLERITAISAAADYYYAACSGHSVQDGHQLLSWGANGYGQLGIGDVKLRYSPTVNPHVTGPIGALTSGRYHTLIGVAGTLFGFGAGGYGTLGTGNMLHSPVPVVADVPEDVRLLGGSSHTACAIVGQGTLHCWGLNNYGQVGDGSAILRTTPVSVEGFEKEAISVSRGTYDHQCAEKWTENRPELYCWGLNTYGQLGNGTTSVSRSPQKVLHLP